jgi:hypothetical protein
MRKRWWSGISTHSVVPEPAPEPPDELSEKMREAGQDFRLPTQAEIRDFANASHVADVGPPIVATASDAKAARDAAIREIADQHPRWREKNADIGFPLVCRTLDAAGVAPLDIWKGKTWTSALEKQRGTVKQYIRKVIKG